MQIVIFIGPPNSGKGTQARLLSQKLDWKTIQSNVLVRGKLSHSSVALTPELRRLKEQYRSGALVDPEFVARWTIEILEKELPLLSENAGLIMDGTCRTLKEARVVYPFLKDRVGKKNIKVFYLKVSEEEVLRRGATRLICERCQEPVPVNFPRDTTHCPLPNCNGKIVKKPLDKPEIIKKRLEVFKEQTLPAVVYLRGEGVICEIDGDQSPEQIHQNILDFLKHDDH